jgi:hypothetical protein
VEAGVFFLSKTSLLDFLKMNTRKEINLLSIARSVLASGPVGIRFTNSGTPLLGDCWTGFGNKT